MDFKTIKSFFENNFIDILVDNKYEVNFPYELFLEKLNDIKYRKLEFIFDGFNSINLIDLDGNDDIVNFNLSDVINSYLDTLPYKDNTKSAILVKLKKLYNQATNGELLWKY